MKTFRSILISLFLVSFFIGLNAQDNIDWQFTMENDKSALKIISKGEGLIFLFNPQNDIISIGTADKSPIPGQSEIIIFSKDDNKEVFSMEMKNPDKNNHIKLNFKDVYNGLNEDLKKSQTQFILRINSNNTAIDILIFQFEE